MHNYSVDQDCLFEQIIESFYPQWFKLPLIAFGYFNKTQLHFKLVHINLHSKQN